MGKKNSNFVWMSVLTLAMLFQLVPILGSYFMADDFAWLSFVKNAKSIWEAATAPSPGGWTTPIPNIYFYSLFRLLGVEPTGYYLANASVHLFNTLIVYVLMRLVSADQRVAITASVIFGLHFSQYSDWGSMVWIAAFVQILVGLFYLISLTLFLTYLRNRYWWSYAGSLFAYCLGLGSKETAISLPVLLLCCVIFVCQSTTISVRSVTKILGWLSPFLIVTSIYLIYEVRFQHSQQHFEQTFYYLGPHIFTNLKFLSNLVVPNPSSPPVHSFLERTFPASILAVADWVVYATRLSLLGAAILILWRGRGISRLWLAMALVCYLPFLGFVEGYAGPNRYLYLSLVGFAALLSLGLWNCYEYVRQTKTRHFATAAAIVFAVLVWGYNLIPMYAWGQQMRINSLTRREVVDVLRRCKLQPNSVLAGVDLVGFPEKFGDLALASDLLFDVPGQIRMTDQGADLSAEENRMLLEYDSGAIEVRSLCPTK